MPGVAEEFMKRHGMHPGKIDMPVCCENFMEEMRRGLAGEPSSLMMLPTYVSLQNQVPQGKPVVILDAGGTNLRVGVAELQPQGFVFSDVKTYPVPGSVTPVSREAFVGYLAELVAPLLEKADRFGFCFSFPSEAASDLDGVVIGFNKEVTVHNAKGMHVCREICSSLEQRGIHGVRYALINDTVATLLGGYGAGSMDYDGYIGLVLGTGTNCSYLEQTSRITKLSNVQSPNMVINMEAGGYSRFPQGDIDQRLDRASTNPGDHLYEKMVSGGYLGALARELLKTAKAEGLFRGEIRDALLETVDMKAVSEFLTDPAGESCLAGLSPYEEDIDILFALLDMLLDRAARMVAVNLISILEFADMGKTKEKPACIIAEGSTFVKSMVYQSKIQKFMKELGMRYGRYFVVCSYDDVNLKGAATAALMVR